MLRSMRADRAVLGNADGRERVGVNDSPRASAGLPICSMARASLRRPRQLAERRERSGVGALLGEIGDEGRPRGRARRSRRACRRRARIHRQVALASRLRRQAQLDRSGRAWRARTGRNRRSDSARRPRSACACRLLAERFGGAAAPVIGRAPARSDCSRLRRSWRNCARAVCGIVEIAQRDPAGHEMVVGAIDVHRRQRGGLITS